MRRDRYREVQMPDPDGLYPLSGSMTTAVP